jgi:tRNA pseudouridine32 synthase / 23S rRNA pseudouridine746 synthase
MTPEEMVSRVLYRDGLMLVIDKPAGMAVHRGPKGGASLEDHFGALRYGLPRAPALAHRLDRETSGCLVLGRHRKALAELGRLFKAGRIGKTYWAVVEGGPEAEEGRIDLPLGRLDATRGWWMKADPKGQQAVTTWRVLGRSYAVSHAPNTPLEGEGLADESRHAPTLPWRGRVDRRASGAPRRRAGWGDTETPLSTPPRSPPPSPMAPAAATDPPPPGERGVQATSHVRKADLSGKEKQLAWLALEPLTGRTHQLRVHCAAMGWPIVGDAIYGSAPRDGGPGLQLLSREIVVPLYKNRASVRVAAPVPAHMREGLTLCGWEEADPPPGDQ